MSKLKKAGYLFLAFLAVGLVAQAFKPLPAVAPSKSPSPKWTETSNTPFFGEMELSTFGLGDLEEKTKTVISSRLKDPSSAIFIDLFLVGDRKVGKSYQVIICGHVNGKNSFGAYTGAKPFLALLASREFHFGDESTKAASETSRLYNKFCAGRHLG